MTSLGSPGLSSRSVSGFPGRKGPKTQKRTGMTTLGSPGLSSQSISGFCAEKSRENPETDWDDKPGKPRLVMPVCFGVCWPKRANKNPKRTGVTTLGNPGLSSQSVLGFSGRKGPNSLETDWDDNSGKPRLDIPIRFGVFWPKRANKNPKRTGMTTLGIRFGVSWTKKAKKP